MSTNLIARATTRIAAPVHEVWKALVSPKDIHEYMFGTTVESDFRVGSPIVWKGEWEGKKYEDKGVILEVRPDRVLRYSHFSPMSGQPDRPENYHSVMIELAEAGNGTEVALSQDGNESEQARQHSQKNWEMMLGALKKHLER